jgi:hypothetical protein
MTKIDKALSNLRKAMKDLPEYQTLMAMKGPHCKVETTLVEYEHRERHHPNVEYVGLAVKSGNNAFLLECCGLEYFTSTLTPMLISAQIQLAVDKVKEAGITGGNSLFGFYVSQQVHEVFSLTDEVYPHMRSSAVGTFVVDKP